MFRYKVTVEYDGSRFCGWQRQQHDFSAAGQVVLSPLVKPSVQGSLEHALFCLTQESVLVEGAGRTDAGVHALAQTAHFDLSKEYDANKLIPGLNFYLRPTGAIITSASLVSTSFHARFSARSRIYLYKILNRRAPSALDEQRVWHVPYLLDLDLMMVAAHDFLGTHDFSAFRAAECQSKNPVKTLDQFDIIRRGENLEYTVKARSFLHNQVRIMVGTLVWIGRGKLPPSTICDTLLSGDRTKAGPTAPPHGLYLAGVSYPPDVQ